MNPLLEIFEYVPFDRIKDEDYLPALKEAIKSAKSKIDAIKANTPGFEATIVELERSGAQVNQIAEIFTNMLSAETNDQLQKIAKEFMPCLTDYSNDLLLDEELYQKVAQVDSKGLNGEDLMLWEKTQKAFIRGGAQLKPKEKERLREIDQELAQLSLNFGENVLKVTNEYFLYVEDKERLKGIPENFISAAHSKAKEKGKDSGWAFTLDYPSFLPLVTYCEDRELRKELSMAMITRCTGDDEVSNITHIEKIVELRAERAKVLGYKTHAHYVLEERMAEAPEKVSTFLNELLEKAKPKALQEIEELREYSYKLDGIRDLYSWDLHYYGEKLKKKLFNIDDEMLRPYLSLDKVVTGLFTVVNKLYGLQFVKKEDIPLYHSDVTAYQVIDRKGEEVGLIYTDFFPRAGKRNGAWMTDYRKQCLDKDGADTRPHVAIVCNFTPPVDDKPALLSFGEVRTLFHECGHALHGLLSKCKYASLSGTNVFWDFVELPSQVMENWLYEPECLSLFAHHWESGELIDSSLIDNIKKSSNFHEATQTLRQLGFGLLDMGWHTNQYRSDKGVIAFEQHIFDKVALVPQIAGACMSCSFGHIFNGGYSSGYYSYKWAEVLDADVFELFKEKGIFDQKTAESFRDNVLSQGATKHPMELFKKFRGREPRIDALLKRGGISSP